MIYEFVRDHGYDTTRVAAAFSQSIDDHSTWMAYTEDCLAKPMYGTTGDSCL
jgi:hypothetical protein